MIVHQDLTSEKFNFGFAVLAGYVFLLMSRVVELIDPNGNFRLMLIGAAIASVLAIVSGGFFRAMATRSGLWLTGATVWMLIGAPFSIWVGGSVNGLVNTWLKCFIVFFLVAGLLNSLPECRKLGISMAWATACIVLTTAIFGVDSADAGRLSGGAGTLGNSNDLATQILIGLPFCVHVITDKKRTVFVRIFFVLVSAAAIVIGMRTGSRGALLSICVLAVLVFWKSSGAARVAIIAAFVAGIIAIPFVLTDDLKNRYLTIFEGEELAQTLTGDELFNVRSAIESSASRQQLIQHAMELSLHHPVFGVGFGQFPVADAARATADGENAYWHQVHNVFLLILVENGLPALIAYLISFGYAYFLVFRIYNRSRGRNEQDREIARMALCLLASLTAYFVCSNFSPSAYGFQFPLLAGFAAAFDMIVTKYQAAQQVERAAPRVTGSPAYSAILKAPRRAPAWRP